MSQKLSKQNGCHMQGETEGWNIAKVQRISRCHQHCTNELVAVEHHDETVLWKCSLRRLLSSSTKPARLSAVRRVDHVRSSSPVWRSPLSQCPSMSRHAPSQSLGWFSCITSLTQPSTPNLRATLCQLAATAVTTSSSTSLMSGVDETSRRARAPEGIVWESVAAQYSSVWNSDWFGPVGNCDEMWRAGAPEGVVRESVGVPLCNSVWLCEADEWGWLGFAGTSTKGEWFISNPLHIHQISVLICIPTSIIHATTQLTVTLYRQML